jgi:hypothetical protein
MNESFASALQDTLRSNREKDWMWTCPRRLKTPTVTGGDSSGRNHGRSFFHAAYHFSGTTKSRRKCAQ